MSDFSVKVKKVSQFIESTNLSPKLSVSFSLLDLRDSMSSILQASR